MTPLPLPEKFDDLPDKRRFWPAEPGSAEEGLGMLRILSPDIVASAARSEIQTGERVCLNWNIEELETPGILVLFFFLVAPNEMNKTDVIFDQQVSGVNHSNIESNGPHRAMHSMTNIT